MTVSFNAVRNMQQAGNLTNAYNNNGNSNGMVTANTYSAKGTPIENTGVNNTYSDSFVNNNTTQPAAQGTTQGTAQDAEGKKKMSTGKKLAIAGGVIAAITLVGLTIAAAVRGKKINGGEGRFLENLREGFGSIFTKKGWENYRNILSDAAEEFTEEILGFDEIQGPNLSSFLEKHKGETLDEKELLDAAQKEIKYVKNLYENGGIAADGRRVAEISDIFGTMNEFNKEGNAIRTSWFRDNGTVESIINCDSKSECTTDTLSSIFTTDDGQVRSIHRGKTEIWFRRNHIK